MDYFERSMLEYLRNAFFLDFVALALSREKLVLVWSIFTKPVRLDML